MTTASGPATSTRVIRRVRPFPTRAIARQARARTYAVLIDVALLGAAAGMFITTWPMSAVRALASSSDVCLRAASTAVNVNMCRTPRHRVRRRRRGQQASRSPSWSTRRRAPTCPTSTPPETECTPTTDVSAARPAACAHGGVSPSPTPHRLSVGGRPPGPSHRLPFSRRQLT